MVGCLSGWVFEWLGVMVVGCLSGCNFEWLGGFLLKWFVVGVFGCLFNFF